LGPCCDLGVILDVVFLLTLLREGALWR